MGLWSSKQSKDIKVTNPEVDTKEIYISQDALDKVMHETFPKSVKPETPTVKESTYSEEAVKGMVDERVAEYEKNMTVSFDKTTRDVENLFNDRYQQIPVCVDLQKSTSQCYSEHPNAPLECLDIANKFIKCVENERQKQLGSFYVKPSTNA